ncbi:MarR family transcriptional regulator [Neobacillus vireti]|uniref:MarR family transcriptional regulator n=1 Tax=Neobacillus vireti TaxID=220686 RepID=UPI002FFD8C01
MEKDPYIIDKIFNEKINQLNNEARIRQYNSNEILSYEEMDQANQLAKKAAERGMKLVPERRVKNKAKFAQLIQENWQYLNKINYLSTAEKAFLLDIIPFIGFRTNCLVENIKDKVQTPLTQEALGERIGKNKSQMSKILKPLQNKYVIFRGATGSEEYNSKSYSLYVNPNIIYCGDRDNVSEHLYTMFPKLPKDLKNIPVNLIPQKTKKIR